MHDGPEWFAPKRYGFGIGAPISWQGWLLTAVFLAILGASVGLLSDNKLALLAVTFSATALFTAIAWRTTRGGWRWGEGD